MPKTLIKSRLHSNKNKPKINQEPDKSKSKLPPNIQSLNRNCYQETALLNINNTCTNIIVLYLINEPRRFSVVR